MVDEYSFPVIQHLIIVVWKLVGKHKVETL